MKDNKTEIPGGTELTGNAKASTGTSGSGGSGGVPIAVGVEVSLRLNVLPDGFVSLDDVTTTPVHNKDSAPLLVSINASDTASAPPLNGTTAQKPVATAKPGIKPATDPTPAASAAAGGGGRKVQTGDTTKTSDLKDVKSASPAVTDSKDVKTAPAGSSGSGGSGGSGGAKSDTKSGGASDAARKALDETESFVLIPEADGSGGSGRSGRYSSGGGFSNQGNTCYLNSGLQCLLSSNRFLRVLRRTVTAHKSSLAAKLNSLTTNPEKVRDFVLSLERASGVALRQQADSGNFLHTILLPQLAVELGPDAVQPMFDAFELKGYAIGLCAKCGVRHPTIPGPAKLSKYYQVTAPAYTPTGRSLSIQDAIQTPTATIPMPCPTCGHKGIQIRMRYESFPDDLVVRLTVIPRQIPDDLNKSPPARLDLSVTADPTHKERDTLIYEFYGAAMYSGTGAFGHYKAIVKRGGSWYDLNDSSVRCLKSKPFKSQGMVPTLLFYRRVSATGDGVTAAGTAAAAASSPPTDTPASSLAGTGASDLDYAAQSGGGDYWDE